MCAPIFNEFMQLATRKYGGGEFDVPPGGYFINIDRFTGARIPEGEFGSHIVAEYFREGEEPVFGVTYDGGFAMGANLPLIPYGEEETGEILAESEVRQERGLPIKADFGTLSSGGLY